MASTRTALLTNVNRMTKDTIADETAAEVKEYFVDITASPSSTTDFVTQQLWGGAETILMASKAVSRDIFVLTELADDTFSCAVFNQRMSRSAVSNDGQR